jgi:hypothetical protein
MMSTVTCLVLCKILGKFDHVWNHKNIKFVFVHLVYIYIYKIDKTPKTNTFTYIYIHECCRCRYSGKDMNVPFLKEKVIKLDMAMDKVKHGVEDYFHKWFGKPEVEQHSFLSLFSKDGTLVRSCRLIFVC